jgi:hypothetical protein
LSVLRLIVPSCTTTEQFAGGAVIERGGPVVNGADLFQISSRKRQAMPWPSMTRIPCS